MFEGVGVGGGGAIKCTREAEIGMAELLEVGEACILLLSMFRPTPGLKRRKSDSSGFATEGPQFLHPHCRRHFIPSGKGLCLSVLV